MRERERESSIRLFGQRTRCCRRRRRRRRKRERERERKTLREKTSHKKGEGASFQSKTQMLSHRASFNNKRKRAAYLFTRHGEHDRARRRTSAMMFVVVARFRSHPPFLLFKEREEEGQSSLCFFPVFVGPNLVRKKSQSLVSQER